MPAPTPKNDWSRQMREAKFANKPKPIVTIEDLELEASAIVARLKAKKVDAKPVANAVANMANTPATYKHRDPDARRAYQRELMRKRREKA